jgi:membrane protease YdiL (CAAX protease family)
MANLAFTLQPKQNPSSPTFIAPVWHATAVLLLLAALVASSSLLRATGHEHNRIASYCVVIAVEWLIAAFIWVGCRLRRLPLRSLLGDMPLRVRTVARDLGLAVAFLIAANFVLGALQKLIHAAPNSALRNLLPHNGVEVGFYLLVALTAALCEEFIYRGYLQQQFIAWTRFAAAGVILQSIVFGICHAYQGAAMVLTITVYGTLFGLLALWRRNLRPGMIAHFLQDGIGGLLLAKMLLK